MSKATCSLLLVVLVRQKVVCLRGRHREQDAEGITPRIRVRDLDAGFDPCHGIGQGGRHGCQKIGKGAARPRDGNQSFERGYLRRDIGRTQRENRR